MTELAPVTEEESDVVGNTYSDELVTLDEFASLEPKLVRSTSNLRRFVAYYEKDLRKAHAVLRFGTRLYLRPKSFMRWIEDHQPDPPRRKKRARPTRTPRTRHVPT